MDLVIPAVEPEPSRSPEWRRGPSPHLSWDELACRDGTPYPEEWKTSRAVPLSIEFEIVRATLSGNLKRDTPIHIGSAYRTLSHNRSVGGSRNSKHVLGLALDLWTPKEIGLLDFLDIVIEVAHRRDGRVRGIGSYPWGVHIDIRSSSRIARWKGGRVSPEVEKRIANV